MVAGALSKFKKKKSHWIPRDKTIYQEKKNPREETSICMWCQNSKQIIKTCNILSRRYYQSLAHIQILHAELPPAVAHN